MPLPAADGDAAEAFVCSLTSELDSESRAILVWGVDILIKEGVSAGSQIYISRGRMTRRMKKKKPSKDYDTVRNNGLVMGHGLMASDNRKAFLKTKKRDKCFDFSRGKWESVPPRPRPATRTKLYRGMMNTTGRPKIGYYSLLSALRHHDRSTVQIPTEGAGMKTERNRSVRK